MNLSERQKKILHFIISFMGQHEYPPTIREIGEEVGISSTSVVNYNLAKLEEYDLIARDREVSRGLSLNRKRLAELGFLGGSNGSANGVVRSSVSPDRLVVPVLGRIAAGEPIGAIPHEAHDPEEWIEIAEGLVNVPADRLFALRVKGNSMIDASVLDGDIVILRQQETANDGEMVAAWIEGDEETTLKYLFRDGANVRLMPANPNPEYKAIVRPAERVRINGKVVSVIRVLN